MSKHKHNRQYNLPSGDRNMTEEIIEPIENVDVTIDIDEPEVVEDDTDTVIEQTESVDVIDEDVSDVVAHIVEPVQVPETTPIVFYKVGLAHINGVCQQMVLSTSDLATAKQTCLNSRDAQKKTYHVFDDNGNAIFTAEYTAPRDNYYRIGTDWKNGVCVNQKYMCVQYSEACQSANTNTKESGIIHHVFDPSGKLVFSSKKKLTLLSLRKRGRIQ